MRAVLIFSGFNDRAVVSFCRFAEERNILFGIVTTGKDDIINLSKHKKHIIGVRKSNKLELKDVVEFSKNLTQITHYTEVLILPSTEFLNRFLLKNKKILEFNKIFSGLANENIYKVVSDKYSFNKLCEKHGLLVPNEYFEKPNFFPYIIKPKKYELNLFDKPGIIYNKKEETDYLLNKNINDYYYQEFVSGINYYLLFYIFKDGAYKVYSQENFIQQANGGSMILAKSSNIHLNKISDKYANMLIDVNFSGLIMVDLKFFKNNFYMIEANPRFWGPSQLILDAEMDLFDCFCLENKISFKTKTKNNNYKENVWYFWKGGVCENNKTNEKIVYHNFDKQQFAKKIEKLNKISIYNKIDTIDYFNSKIKNCK